MFMFKFTIMLMVFKRCTGITNQVLVGAGVSGSLHGPGILLAGERLLWAGHFRWEGPPTHSSTC